MSGVKRASGADEEKNPLGDVELSDEDAQKLQVVQKDIARAELVLGAYKHCSFSLWAYSRLIYIPSPLSPFFG